MATEKAGLTKQELNKLWWRYMWSYNSSASYERFHAMGIVYSLLPLWHKYYDKAKQFEAMKRHTIFYNTEMQVGSIVQGIVVGLEEQKALGKEVDDDVIRSTKVGLMGPLAGIGDSIWVGVVIPILLSIAVALSAGGNVIGPLFYVVAYLALTLFGSKYLFDQGYRMGVGAVQEILGEKAQKVVTSVLVLGVIVMGGVAASYVSLSTPLALGSGQKVQDIFDGILPHLLPLLLVLGVWALMAKKKVSPLVMVLILAAFSFIAAFFKII